MRRAITIFVLMALPASVAAQTNLPQAGEAMNADPCATGDCHVRTTEPLELEFEAESVQGESTRPDELEIHAHKHQKRSSLIRVRPDFLPELLTSVDHI